MKITKKLYKAFINYFKKNESPLISNKKLMAFNDLVKNMTLKGNKLYHLKKRVLPIERLKEIIIKYYHKTLTVHEPVVTLETAKTNGLVVALSK